MTLAISAVTALAVFLSVLIKPEMRVGKLQFGPYWVIALIGAAALLLFKCLPLKTLFAGLTAATAVNPLKILVLFFSMTFLSVFLDELGFFRYLAGRVLTKAKGSQIKLFFALYAVVSVLTVFTSNDIIVLTFTPFICFFAKSAKVSPVPYLFGEFVAANTWSMMLVIGNPTNIYLAASAELDFLTYLSVMALPTLLAGATSFGMLLLLFFKQLKAPLGEGESAPLREGNCASVPAAPLREGESAAERIADKPALIVGIMHLSACTLLLVLSSYIGFEMWLVAAAFALSLGVFSALYYAVKKQKPTPLFSSARRLPYALVPFVFSMFTIVLALNHGGVTTQIAQALSHLPAALGYGVSSFFAANIINNIPMSVLFSGILAGAGAAATEGVYAAIIGSNLGAYFAPVGALAGIMWMSILKRCGVNFSFGKFVKYGAAVSLPTLAVALAALTLAV